MQKYDESTKIALDNGEYELAIIMTQNIANEEKQRKIWIKLFNFFKNNKKYSPKNILELSNGVLNIEDILPYMDDEIKLQDIKIDLQECIDVYEEGVSQLKQKIKTYNKSNNHIQEDIYIINKRKIDLDHSKIKCHKCQNNISENKFFLFPCGHIFDADCIIKLLIEYDNNGIGGEELNGKVKAIKSLTEKIMNMQRKKSFHKKNIIIGGLSKFGKKTKKTMKMFLTFVKIDQKGKLIDKEKENEKEKDKPKIIEEELTKEEEIQLKELSNGLYTLLKEECVLCGQEMINSTQIQFSKEDDENKKWEKLVE
jgi:rRNA maturation protein Nop10